MPTVRAIGSIPRVSERILAKGSPAKTAPAGLVGALLADIYFSVDVETDGPIPGPYSMLSFALVSAGRMDGNRYSAPANFDDHFYVELKPISEQFENAALAVNGLDRDRLSREGQELRALRWDLALQALAGLRLEDRRGGHGGDPDLPRGSLGSPQVPDGKPRTHTPRSGRRDRTSGDLCQADDGRGQAT